MFPVAPALRRMSPRRCTKPIHLQYPSRCGDGALCFIVVNSNGNVDFGGSGSPAASLNLDGITFDTRQ